MPKHTSESRLLWHGVENLNSDVTWQTNNFICFVAIVYSLMNKSGMAAIHKMNNQRGAMIQSLFHLCVVPRPRFMRVHAPLFILGSRPVQEKRDIIIGIPAAVFRASPVALRSTWRVEVWCHIYRAVGCGVFSAGEMKHVHSLRVQHTHHLATE